MPGYSPCYYQNFTGPYTVKYTMVCKSVDANGLVEVQREQVGYEYRDVIKEPEFVPFSYVSQNHETSFSVLDEDSVQVTIDFRDFKYLSHKTRFNGTANSTVISGNATGSLEVDFRQIVQSDATGDSHYVVGGRAYFEASIFGNGYNSFTYKGFFDQEGYEEPKSTIGKLKKAWVWVLIVGGVLIVAAIVVTIICCRRRKGSKSKVE